MKKTVSAAMVTLTLAGATFAWGAGDLSGDYQKTGKHAGSDSITVTKTASGYTANLSAMWQTHMGELSIDIPEVSAKTGKYAYKSGDCNLTLTFKGKTVKVAGHKDGTCDAGQNVDFNGTYKKK